MEGDVGRYADDFMSKLFQSTPSAWRETFYGFAVRNGFVFQSTPSAWRETVQGCLCHADRSFQSTPSAWRET